MKNLIVVTVALCMNITAMMANTQRFRRDYDWVFPGDDYVPTIPETCVNSTFCSRKCPKYPQNLMDQIVIDNNLEPFSVQEIIIGSRASFDEDEDSTLCSSVTTSVVIYEAQNQNGEWRYIVQSSTKKYQQILVTSVCSTPKGACNNIAVFQSSVTPRCEQQYADRLLFSLGPEGQPMRDSFRIPSCCVCTFSYKE